MFRGILRVDQEVIASRGIEITRRKRAVADDDNGSLNDEQTPDAASSTSDDDVELVLYWRPGCWYCGSMIKALERAGVSHVRRNIWEDPEAAAFVRSAANGNETVPTVSFRDSVWVNPSPKWLISEIGFQAPGLIQTPTRKGFFRRG